MSSPTEHSTPSGGTPDQRGELLEQYIITMAEGKIRTEVGEDDARVRAFVEAHPELIRVTDELRASWRGELTGRMVEIPPRAGAPLETLDHDIRRWEGFKGRPLLGGVFKGQPLRSGIQFTLAGVMLGMAILAIGWRVSTTGLGARYQSAVSTYVTENGQRANITLPDGNTVALNVASRLDVPTDYMAGNHVVHLTGEALFTATHHASTPITVVAGAITARVLGTSFSVRHYATDTSAFVAVREGKVAVGTTVATAGQLVEVGRHGVNRLSSAGPGNFSFATGTLVLHRIRLSDAIPELDRWYDVDLRLNDEALKDQVVNATLKAGSRSDLESILELSYNVRVVRNGRVLTLSSR